MTGFPFVVGTDIVQISRFDLTTSLSRIQRLAGRFLHPAELAYLETRYPNHHRLLRATNPRLLSSKRNTSEVEYLSGVKKSVHHHLCNDQLLQSNADAQKLKSWLAGRWAAKEAARKAWGADIIGYKDVRVEVGNPLSSTSSASVSIVCEPFLDSGEATDELCQGSKNPAMTTTELQPTQEGALSISHDGDYVVATVIAEPLTEGLRSYFRSRSEEARKTITGLSR